MSQCQLIRIFLLLTSMLVVVGCGDTAPPKPVEPAPQSEVQSGSVETPNPEGLNEPLPVDAASSAVSLELRSLAEIDELVASHKGKVVVLDLWALW